MSKIVIKVGHIKNMRNPGGFKIYTKLNLYIIISLIISLVFILTNDFFSSIAESNIHEIEVWYYVGTVCVTYLIVITQLSSLNKTNQSEFLLRIDERWSSESILIARMYFHTLLLELRAKNNNVDPDISIIGYKLIEMSRDETKVKEYIYLKNLLEFFETIGFLYAQERINTKEADELIGNSILYFYKAYEPYIIHQRKNKNDNNLYYELENLYKNMRNIKRVNL